MEFIDAIKRRYATKLYDPTKRLDKVTITQIAQILHLSPSSINSQPWQFTIVSDQDLKTTLAESSYFNKPKIEQAATLVIFSVASNLRVFEDRITADLPEMNVNYYNSVIKSQGEEYAICWFSRQLYIAVGVLLSACASMGLDSTPMEGIDSSAYDSILGNTDYRATVAVAIGYRDPADHNQPEITPKQRRPLDEVVIIH